MKIPTTLRYSGRWTALITLGTLFLLSCQSDESHPIEMMAQDIKINNCKMEEISQYVDESWTAAIDKMSTMLPDWLPSEEREKILNLRYASLFRLFETYKDFDPSVHALVDSMEILDANWADSLRQISLENQNLEMKMDSVFATVNDQETEQMLMEKVEEIQSSPCPGNLLNM